MSYKFIAFVFAIICIALAVFIAGAPSAKAGHNRDRIVERVYIPAKQARVVKTPYCTERIYFTSRGRHVRAGIQIAPAITSVVVANDRSRGITARVACGNRYAGRRA